MPKWIAASLALAAASVVIALPMQARAEIQYPWCAEYGGRGNEATNCGFETLAQCRANISGIGGWCYENPAYTPGPRVKKKPGKPR
jgi:hypothetical protein